MSEFIKMTKDGETIEVSPLVVEDHKHLGWKVVEETAKAEVEADVDIEAKAKAKAEAKAEADSKK